MSRILALDYGSKTIGVAISDPTCKIALGLETIRRPRESAQRSSLRRLSDITEEYSPITAIVLGFPKNMDNTEGERCAKTLLFKEKLTARFVSIPVILWDERLSTAEAKRSIDKSNLAKIDEIAATLILQGYLDSLQNLPFLSSKEG
ncbi:MAG: Holliday junction resolvase RuvX [Firmicutes bacterium]|nr:Holliday junction resolvase RuvX [Bacillota bacterium]